MSIDIYLKVDAITHEVSVLCGSERLYSAINQCGEVVAHDVETNQPFVIYKEGNTLMAKEIKITG